MQLIDSNARVHWVEFAPQDTVFSVLERAKFLHDKALEAWCKNHQTAPIDPKDWRVGVYGQKIRLDAVLDEGARLELYAPLCIDPKTRRKHVARNG